MAHMFSSFCTKNNWKTQAQIEDLTPSLCALMLEMIESCPNLVFSPTKLKNAVLACQRKASCNLTRLSEMDFSEQIGMIIRIVASKFRMLKDDQKLLKDQLARVAL